MRRDRRSYACSCFYHLHGLREWNVTTGFIIRRRQIHDCLIADCSRLQFYEIHDRIPPTFHFALRSGIVLSTNDPGEKLLVQEGGLKREGRSIGDADRTNWKTYESAIVHLPSNSINFLFLVRGDIRKRLDKEIFLQTFDFACRSRLHTTKDVRPFIVPQMSRENRRT